VALDCAPALRLNFTPDSSSTTRLSPAFTLDPARATTRHWTVSSTLPDSLQTAQPGMDCHRTLP
jgi:hypothetical protein